MFQQHLILSVDLPSRSYAHPSSARTWMMLHPIHALSSGVVSLSSLNFLREAVIVAIAEMASTSLSLPGACNLRVFAASNSTPSAFGRTSISFLGHALESQLQSRCSHRRRSVVVRAEEEEVISTEVKKAKGLSRETGGKWLSCTTRHVRIYSGVVDPVTDLMDQSQLDKLTLMLDPDNEFDWPEEATEKVYDKFRELIDIYAGADFTEYTLRLIGSDLEHYIRKLLLAGELKYNLECRVLNFSMGRPRIDPAALDDVEVEE